MDYPHVDPIIGALVANKYATMHELNTVYTIEQAYDLYEILAVTRYNEFMAIKEANERRK